MASNRLRRNMNAVAQTRFDSVTIQARAPEGKMFVTIMENEAGQPIQVAISMGKSGAALSAWAHSMSALISDSLVNNETTINKLIASLSQHTSDRFVMDGDIRLRSGPEALCYALMQYRKIKFNELRNTLGANEDDYDGPRLYS